MTDNTKGGFPSRYPEVRREVRRFLDNVIQTTKAEQAPPPIITPPPKEEIDRHTAEVLAKVVNTSKGVSAEKDWEECMEIIKTKNLRSSINLDIVPEDAINQSILRSMIDSGHPGLKIQQHDTKKNTEYTPEKIKDPWS
jgi:hypothetical protein